MSKRAGITLTELIHELKRELLHEPPHAEDQPPLFYIDEILLDVGLIASKRASGEIELEVVDAGSNIAEARVHRATIRLSSLLSREQLASSLSDNLEMRNAVVEESVRVLLKGGHLSRPPGDPTTDAPPPKPGSKDAANE
ncbi:MAG TPA: hypothetical protein PKO09_01640 [Anaerolineae bacterium]|nr:hypothetical protein [Anaerolineae bacterium]